ncbi:MAG: hypothetical protein RLZZ618_1968, partial [Pseudomonadota bacterium]
RVGSMSKSFIVTGERHWQKRIGHVAASEPQPFVRQPLSYDVAYGGTDRTEEAEGRTDTYCANPVGRGYWRHTAEIDGQPLPHTEARDKPVTAPDGNYAPMALSPIGRNWVPRIGHAGSYDSDWVENHAPFWPDDFDHRYFQAAPPDQVIPYPVGGEEVLLHHLTPDGQRSFALPQRSMPVTFIPHTGRDLTVQAVIDTLVFEPDAGHFTVTWRASLRLGRSVFDVKETIVGEMSAAWHRARRFPGKTYYASLSELVAARKGA